MSGRGRGISNAPAWMTRGGEGGGDDRLAMDNGPPLPDSGGYRGGGPPPRGGSDGPPPHYFRNGGGPPPRYDDRGGPPPNPYSGGGGGPPRSDNFGGGPPRGPPPSRGGPPFHAGGPSGARRGGEGGSGGPGGPGGGRPGMPGAVIFRSYEEEREWVEERRRKRMNRPSKFDVLPGAAALPSPPPNVPSTAVAPPQLQQPFPHQPHIDPALLDTVQAAAAALAGSQQTRHARRLYVGNLPLGISEDVIHSSFRQAITTAWNEPQPLTEDPILSVYINHERRFCFLEFKTMEMATACMNLDGLQLHGQALKIKRPNDYHESMASQVTNKIPDLDVSRLGIMSSNVVDGPNKIFIGGLHYHLTDAQVLELLQAFGKIRAFHLVKSGGDESSGSHLSKGYCFVEYADPSVTATAIAGLNNMDIGGGKTLTARLAGERPAGVLMGPDGNPLPGSALVPEQLLLQQQQQQQQVVSTPLPGAPPPDRNIVSGYDIEALVDAAMGQGTMPTAPVYLDALGMPLTRIVSILPPSLPPLPAAVLPTTRPPPTAINVILPPMPSHLNAVLGQPSLAQQPALILPDRVLCLHNMVQPDDLETDASHRALVDEVQDECRKYGNLLRCEIPRFANPPLVQHSAVGKIYLEYATPQEARNAQLELDGRAFGSAVVKVTMYPQTDFAAGKMA